MVLVAAWTAGAGERSRVSGASCGCCSSMARLPRTARPPCCRRPRLVLCSSIEPGALKLRTVAQCSSAVNAGPMMRPLDKALLDAVAEKIGEASDLRLLFVGDEDRSISPRPELLAPAMQPPDLTSDIPGHVVHEDGQLLRGVGRQQQVCVVAQDDNAMNPHSVPALGTTDNPDDEVVDSLARTQQEPSVQRTERDFDERVGRQEAEGASHGRNRRKTAVDPCRGSREVGGRLRPRPS
jgi:hypothetical protein